MIKRSTWVVVALFAILLSAVLLLQRTDDDASEQALPTVGENQRSLFSLGERYIVGVQLVASDGRIGSYERNDAGVWTMVEPQVTEVESTKMDEFVTSITGLRTLAQMDPGISLMDVGLNPPRFTLKLTLDDGQTRAAYIGNLTPTGSGYYIQSEEAFVVIVGNSNVDPVLEILDNPPFLPTITPEIVDTPEVDFTETPVATPTTEP
jgi:hypothetical protein